MPRNTNDARKLRVSQPVLFAISEDIEVVGTSLFPPINVEGIDRCIACQCQMSVAQVAVYQGVPNGPYKRLGIVHPGIKCREKALQILRRRTPNANMFCAQPPGCLPGFGDPTFVISRPKTTPAEHAGIQPRLRILFSP